MSRRDSAPSEMVVIVIGSRHGPGDMSADRIGVLATPGAANTTNGRTAAGETPAPDATPGAANTPTLQLDISGRAYTVAALAIVAVYLGLWLASFRYVYGWFVDDVVFYSKGLAAADDWTKAFTLQYNAFQAYFFVILYLPIKLGWSLPSYPLPLFGEQTGHFRFVLLWVLLLHTVLLMIWAWFATVITGNRLVALLSLLLFATSPTLLLWSPQPDSRLLGLPLTLPGLWFLLCADPAGAAGRWSLGRLLLAGSLLGLAQSTQYTSLYLIMPVCVVFWGIWLWRHWRQTRFWLGALSFGAGCVWLQAGLEVLSDVVVGTPWEEGPLMVSLLLRTMHQTPLPLSDRLVLWSELFVNQVGLPLLAAVGIGWVLYLLDRDRGSNQSLDGGGDVHGTIGRTNRLALGLSILLGLAYLGLGGGAPFFRQTSVLQPFLFLFASVAVVSLASAITRTMSQQWPALRFGVVAVLLAAVAVIPWSHALAVFEAHQGVGRALEWAYTNKGDRELKWLHIAFFAARTDVASLAELEQAPPDAWLMTYYPLEFTSGNPSVYPYLQDAQPLASWPSLWGTDALWAENKGFFFFALNDFRRDPLLGTARVVEIGPLLASMRGRPLPITGVTADSVADDSTSPLQVFDREDRKDGVTAWASASTPPPHFLQIEFAEAVPLSEMRIVLPPLPNVTSRVVSLDVQVADEQHTYQTVWSGTDLRYQAIVAPRWESRLATGVRLVVHRQVEPLGETDKVVVEEIVFPGYQVIPPP